MRAAALTEIDVKFPVTAKLDKNFREIVILAERRCRRPPGDARQ